MLCACVLVLTTADRFQIVRERPRVCLLCVFRVCVPTRERKTEEAIVVKCLCECSTIKEQQIGCVCVFDSVREREEGRPRVYVCVLLCVCVRKIERNPRVSVCVLFEMFLCLCV